MAKSPRKAEDTRVEPNHGPVTIPAGSYDREALDAGLDAAVDTYGANRGEELGKALETARVRVEGDTSANPATLPDHKFVEVPTQLGDDGQPLRTEVIQVYDQQLEEQHVAARQPQDSSTTALLDEKGEPTDLEKARMQAVEGEGIVDAVTAPESPLSPADPPALTPTPDAGQGDETDNAQA